MKRLVVLLLLLAPSFLFAQNEPLQVIRMDADGTTLMSDTIPALTMKDRREPLLAGFLSYLMPGMGQVYNKQYEKALGIWAVLGTSMVLSYQSMVVNNDETSSIFMGVGMMGTWLYSLFDAVTQAKMINRNIELQLNKQASLSLKPDIQFNQSPPLLRLSSPQPTIGLKLSLSL